MKNLKLILTAICMLLFTPSYADEGMWLLQLMKEQNLADRMKQQGLQLDVDSIYNPNYVTLKDAVGIFGRGCTGEIISPEGLILTNHHCGYDAIQQHSSVEHDYLTDGFWAMNRSQEIPTPGLTFTFIERIEDITELVNQKIASGEITETESFTAAFLQETAEEILKNSDLNGKAGISVQALPFYAGNRFYLFYQKQYTDIRMVAAPPSSIGKFGGETDNWMWPRHTGDFSIFRIYGDTNGEPAEYNAGNVPLQTRKHLTISLNGVEEGDYSMIMGFPGSTSRYLTAAEIRELMESQNTPRIQIREARQEILREEMNKSNRIRIQYASKYARSSNYWKNSIGMNKAIIDNAVIETKEEQERRFNSFAVAQNNDAYRNVVNEIGNTVTKTSPLTYELIALREVFFSGIEFGAPYLICDTLLSAIKNKDKVAIQSSVEKLKAAYEAIHNKDYDHEVDRKVASRLIPLYAEMIPAAKRPAIFTYIDKEYKGDYQRFVDDMYTRSIFANRENFDAFVKKPTRKALEADPAIKYSRSKHEKLNEIQDALKPLREQANLLHKTYVRGLGEMNAPEPQYPDANFTIRLTYGNVKAYDPRDGVHYDYYTTTDGILEKEDPQNREFNVPAKLKQLILNKDFGRYALPDGSMPVCFISNNDITGGNSGSPVINGKGQLIGCAFDGNWESLSGDINFDDKLQRCINVDIRYILFIIDKLGNANHLIEEMTIVN